MPPLTPPHQSTVNRLLILKDCKLQIPPSAFSRLAKLYTIPNFEVSDQHLLNNKKKLHVRHAYGLKFMLANFLKLIN